jgi:hypothetical protein
MLSTEASDYETKGYAFLKGAASPELVATLAAIISGQLNAAQRQLRAPSISNKPTYEIYGYNYPLVAGFHWGLTSRVAMTTRRRLAPTYAFFRVYQQGDVCNVHSDRPACEHSISMPLAYADGVTWGFEVGRRLYDEATVSAIKMAPDFGNEGSSTVMLEPGDAVVYRGTALRHGRVTPNPNRWSAHLFMHWIDLDGPHKDFAYDRHKMPTGAEFTFAP